MTDEQVMASKRKPKFTSSKNREDELEKQLSEAELVKSKLREQLETSDCHAATITGTISDLRRENEALKLEARRNERIREDLSQQISELHKNTERLQRW